MERLNKILPKMTRIGHQSPGPFEIIFGTNIFKNMAQDLMILSMKSQKTFL